MGKLDYAISHTGLNAGVAVVARMAALSEIKEDPVLAGIFTIDEGVLAAITQSMHETGYDKSQFIKCFIHFQTTGDPGKNNRRESIWLGRIIFL